MMIASQTPEVETVLAATSAGLKSRRKDSPIRRYLLR